MLFVIDLFNVLANRHGEIPLEMLTNQTVDISAYLSFHFWEEVFVSVDSDDHLKRKRLGKEELARWCGPASTINFDFIRPLMSEYTCVDFRFLFPSIKFSTHYRGSQKS
jgi:hypothetical protein